MKKEQWLLPLNFVAAIIIAILVITASVTFTLFDRGAYERMQERIDLPAAVGISEEELLANYNALIDYNSVFFTGPLEFPTLGMSETGRIHFEEVKAIFSIIQIALIISAALTILLCVSLLRRRRYRFLALGGILTLAIPAVIIAIMGAVGWDRFFVLFHELFFNNEYWVFDAATDPVILILPDTFFLSCLIRIVTGIVVSGAALIVCSGLMRRRDARSGS